jgi:hypothetical protein
MEAAFNSLVSIVLLGYFKPTTIFAPFIIIFRYIATCLKPPEQSEKKLLRF